ncbi:hypothetical protein HJG54_22630 [Leptolyngbya sp. NK1-12]|uniref:Uncharacterized protein n=1 Tax=Leptolyngbya sp. NK1-12 TaxID=2547451 RepID=A0AA96WIM0_9CYAN|nr:hypothetical protein [Leptolyngbya sp. NK1-12]WNZ25370.1 hypothetical protein HJG54_22630 [Leptolyngbya sp. NK1-12]
MSRSRDQWIKRYRTAFLLFAILVSVPAAFLFLVSISKLSIPHLLFWGAVLLVVWGSYLGIKQNKKITFWLSLLPTTALWLLLLARTVQRIQFVVANGGMERADGYGSPLAFLVGLIGEQLFFLPSSLVVVIGWLIVYQSFSTRSSS